MSSAIDGSRPARSAWSASLTWTIADDGVDRAAHDRDARVLGLDEEVEEHRQRGRDVDPDDVGARRHDLAHARVAEVDDRQQELLLVLLEDSLLPADVDVGVDLLLGGLGGASRRRGARPAKIRRIGKAIGSRSHEAAVMTGSRRATIFSGSRLASRRSSADLRQEPARTKKSAAPRATAAATSKVSSAETVVRRPASSSAWTRTLVVVRTISTSPGAREDARALGVLLEEPAHLDRREPVEREGERLEEEEREVAEARREERDHRALRGPRTGRRRSGDAEPAPQPALQRFHLRPRRSRGRSPGGGGSRGARSRSISRAGGSPRRRASPRRVRHGDHDVAEEPVRRSARRKREHVGRPVLARASGRLSAAHPPVAAEEDRDLAVPVARAARAARATRRPLADAGAPAALDRTATSIVAPASDGPRPRRPPRRPRPPARPRRGASSARGRSRSPGSRCGGGRSSSPCARARRR